MRIHLYAMCWNEEFVLPYFLRHYSRFCEKMVFFDNESTNRSVDIIKSFPGAQVRSWSSGNQLNDQMHLDIKNSAYRESRGAADWVIVCDTDEFLYHPRLVDTLRRYQRWGINYPKVAGFDMVPDAVPAPDADLPLTYRDGVPTVWMNKHIVFSPQLDMAFHPGSHTAERPKGARSSLTRSLKLLHYKMINRDYFLGRDELMASRLSELNRSKGWGVHYSWPRETRSALYDEALRDRRRVV